ncbi:hypothetical protein H0H93_008242 [Arthromyces matolae]|nr:hypothetical protein H0H93_008242 [Arthromyces matolae]
MAQTLSFNRPETAWYGAEGPAILLPPRLRDTRLQPQIRVEFLHLGSDAQGRRSSENQAVMQVNFLEPTAIDGELYGSARISMDILDYPHDPCDFRIWDTPQEASAFCDLVPEDDYMPGVLKIRFNKDMAEPFHEALVKQEDLNGYSLAEYVPYCRYYDERTGISRTRMKADKGLWIKFVPDYNKFPMKMAYA